MEEKDWPPTDKLEYWSMVIILVSIEMFKKFAPVSMAGAPTDLRMENKNKSDVMWTWQAIQGKYDRNEDNLITRLRIRVDAFIDDTEEERPIAFKYDKRSVNEYLKTAIDTMVSRMALENKWPDTLLDDTHKGILLKQLPSPPQSSQPSQLNAPEKDITDSDRVALEEMGIVQTPDKPDPVPPKGLSIMQVQRNTVEKAKKERKPMPGAYNPIVEYTQSLLYKKGKAAVLDGYAKDFKAAHVILMPTLKDRGNYFYVHTEECDIEKPLAKIYEDGTNTVTDKNYTLGGVQYNMNTVFVPSSKYNKFEYSETTDPNRTYRIYAVHADDSQSVGLFGDKQMNNFYQQMVVKGIVMFSVNESKAIQFFPEQYCCSNVWWWESKLNFLPSTLRFHKMGQGSFNVVYRLVRNNYSTKNPLVPPDHFLFLPPTRVAYDMSLNQRNLQNAFASTKQNGILYRIAYFPDDDGFGIQGPMRELMMAGYAASKNIGPKIFAAYVIPEGAYPPMMKMNPGDEDEQLANPIYCANPGRKAGEKPSSPWYSSKMFWKDIVNEKGPEWSLFATPKTDWQYQETRTGGWRKMVVVMESYTADVTKLRITNEEQKREVVNKLFECFEKMGKAGILHCDMKPQNMVQRTWKEGKIAKYFGSEWNKIEIRAIDFDPFFVKIVPWLPWEVIALINAVEYFAFLTCHSSHYFDSKLTIEKLAALNKTCNEQYPDGIAAAFRALKPNYDGMRKGPVNLNGKYNDRHGALNDNKESVPYQLYNMFSDEWEAARAFRRWTGWYMEQNCSDYGATSSNAPADAGMLARLLSWIKEKDASKAEFNPQKPGNVPFVDGKRRSREMNSSKEAFVARKKSRNPNEQPMEPRVTELTTSGSSGIWRDSIVLGRVGHL